jgi:LacI family transcriptional regulator
MTRHLIALGHQRIGFVVGHPNQTASARRLEGYRAAIADKGADSGAELVVQGMFTYRSGLDAAEQLLAIGRAPTAIFASNDDMAAATVAVAHRLGLDVPGDLTVTGFDDTALATTIWPELTTVRQPIAGMAREAVQSLVRRVRALREGAPAEPEQVRMDFELVRRQSDAAPRTRPQTKLAAAALRPQRAG